MAQFVLVNVVVAVLMKHLEESHKQMDDDLEMEAELVRELLAEQQQIKEAEMEQQAKPAVELTEKVKERKSPHSKHVPHKPLVKMASLPPNFVFPFNSAEEKGYRRASLNLQSCRNTTDCIFTNSQDLAMAPPSFKLIPPLVNTSSVATTNVNIRQASPDETDSKVSVANLSPIPLRSTFGSTLSVPNATSSCQKMTLPQAKCEVDPKKMEQPKDQQRDDSARLQTQPLDDWKCVFASMNTDPYKVHFLPVLHNDVISSTNLYDNKLCDPLGADRNRSASNAFLPDKSNKSDDCDSGCASIDRNLSNDRNNSLRTPYLYKSNSGEASFSSPSIVRADIFQGDEAPLIIRRIRKKLINLGGESSLSSQSDAPDNNKDKSFTTDSTSLEC
ncbi:Voltage-dependent T-type calcium channel subunit alpha-1I, partial [Stegodyphus mimosarum]